MRNWLLSFFLMGSTLFSGEQMVKEAPYGSWVSPFTGDLLVSDAVKFGGARVVNGGVYWSELRPKEKGRTAVIRVVDGKLEELLPSEYNARTRVHEYGGLSFLVAGDTVYFSNDSDQQLYSRGPCGCVEPLTEEKNTRFADGAYDPSRDLLYYVIEVHGKEVENCLASINPKSGEVRRVEEGYDFYSNPRVSPDGKQIAYVCWNHPNLPWDGCELWIAELKEDGSFGKKRLVAGGLEESISEPSWSPDGTLYFVSDKSNWWNLYRYNKGKVEPVHPLDAEFTFPQWVFGQQNYDFWGKDRIVCSYSKLGVDYLGVISLERGSLKQIEVPFTFIHSLSLQGDDLYFIGGSPDFPPSLIQFNLKSNEWKAVKKSRDLHVDPAYFSKPKPVEFPTENGLTAFAFYYPPANPKYKGMPDEKPPLLVLSHGGPTSHVSPILNLDIQYWTSRGFAVIDVNYGGSTGYGREYRERLKKNWGVVDVDDCTNAALYCTQMGFADENRLAISGGSAGGYTTLACLAFRDVFHAGASLFGVSDLEALTKDTHKFEARYNDQLVGPYPEARDLYYQRSPINFVDQIQCPVIILQGDEDAIVPPDQSEKMYLSLKERGIPTAYILFKGEQHGFRQAANIKRCIESIAYFFSKVFGFKLADKVEPVKIDNLND